MVSHKRQGRRQQPPGRPPRAKLTIVSVQAVNYTSEQLLPLTRRQYDLLIEAGELDGQHVELLEGMLVRVSPQGPLHSEIVQALGNRAVVKLYKAFGERYASRVQLPIIAPDESEPEPDFAVVDGDLDRSVHPSFAHLVVEVTDSSARIDLVRKPRIYARAGIPTYWVVHVRRREVAVHTVPRDEGYARIEWVGFDVPLDLVGLTVTMDELLV